MPSKEHMPACERKRPPFHVDDTNMPAYEHMHVSDKKKPPFPDNNTNMPDDVPAWPKVQT